MMKKANLKHEPATLKQWSAWIFAMVFWLIAMCALFSSKINEEMIPQITRKSVDATKSTLPIECLQSDGETEGHLYMIYDGSGWEKGKRVHEITDYTPLEETREILMTNSNDEDYVLYSSKPFSNGAQVNIEYTVTKNPDTFLAVFQNNVPNMDDLGGKSELLAQIDNSVLVFCKSADQPFLEGRSKNQIPALAGSKIYSLAEMEKMLNNFGLLGAIIGVLLSGLLIWIYSWRQMRRKEKYGKLPLFNALLAAILLISIAAILHHIDLPSALLPPKEITDMGYYMHEFKEFFGAIRKFDGQVEAAGVILNRLNAAKLDVLRSVFAAAGISSAILLAEELFARWRVSLKSRKKALS